MIYHFKKQHNYERNWIITRYCMDAIGSRALRCVKQVLREVKTRRTS